MQSSPSPEFGPNGAVLNSPTMTDEMREKIAGAYRAPVRDLSLKDRLIRLILSAPFAFALALHENVPLWVPLIPIGVVAAETARNGLTRKGIEPWLWRAAGIFSLLWFTYCLVFWNFGETRP